MTAFKDELLDAVFWEELAFPVVGSSAMRVFCVHLDQVSVSFIYFIFFFQPAPEYGEELQYVKGAPVEYRRLQELPISFLPIVLSLIKNFQ